jgi:nucleobase:cation symporter-1, NCS1 family
MTTASTAPLEVEARSIDWVPESERHGKVSQQGPLWFFGNLEFLSIAIGFIGPSLGLALGWSILAGALGILFGTVFMAFHATQGPVMGLPQMVQSRAQLGHGGVVVALLGSFATCAGTCIAATVLLSQGLHGVFGWDPTAVAIVSAVIAVFLAVVGYDLLHASFRLLLYVSLPFYAVLTVGILVGAAGGGNASPDSSFTLAAFVAQFTAAAAWNITYAPFVSDYSRYLPRSAAGRPIIAHVFFGASTSAIWLIAIGAWLATSFGATDALVGLRDAGDEVVNGLGDALAILSALGLVGVMGLNTYSGQLTILTAADTLRPFRPGRRARVAVIAGFGLAWLVVGVAIEPDAITTVFTALTLMLYLLVPWTAINLVDFFFIRRGHYAISELFKPDGIYGRWNWRGLSAFGAGFAASIPFMYLPDLYTGPMVDRLDGVDVALFVGLPVSALTYYLLNRHLDLPRERALAAADLERLEGAAAAARVALPA